MAVSSLKQRRQVMIFDIVNIVLDLFGARKDEERTERVEALVKALIIEKQKTVRHRMINTILLSLILVGVIVILYKQFY